MLALGILVVSVSRVLRIPTVCCSEVDEFLEGTTFSFTLPNQSNFPKDAKVRDSHLLYGWDLKLTRHKGQAYSSRNKRQSHVIAISLICHPYRYALGCKQIGYVLQSRIALRQNERFVIQIAKGHGLPFREAMILSNGQHVRHFEKYAAGGLRFLAVEDRQHRIELVPGSEPQQLSALAQCVAFTIDSLNGHMRLSETKSAHQSRNTLAKKRPYNSDS